MKKDQVIATIETDKAVNTRGWNVGGGTVGPMEHKNEGLEDDFPLEKKGGFLGSSRSFSGVDASLRRIYCMGIR